MLERVSKDAAQTALIRGDRSTLYGFWVLSQPVIFWQLLTIIVSQILWVIFLQGYFITFGLWLLHTA